MAVSLREVVSFGRYEPLFRIASGGMAEVYAARIRGEAGFQKLVAVKRMHPHLATDPTFVDMFLNEARLAAHIGSAHVVPTLDLGRGSDGSLYIVMELVVGVSLAALLEDHPGPLPVPIAVEIAAQAAQGLDDAHEATTPAGDALGLIHRDISPHNVLIGMDGRARVTDWGIARAMHRPRPETNHKELRGKFGYMSPEQTRLRPLDLRSDLFSLGIVAWEMLVGRRLFAVDDPTASIINVRKGAIPSPHQERSAVPPEISAVVLRALERSPEARFASGADFAHELRQVGRDVLEQLPTRKQVGAFVRSSGGDELERLRRLIRLGTEGADEAAIEAVKPGATRVLAAGDLSGVAVLGTGAKRVTAVLEDAPPPSVSFVALTVDDEPFHTAEIDVLSRSAVPTELLNRRAKADPDSEPLTEIQLHSEDLTIQDQESEPLRAVRELAERPAADPVDEHEDYDADYDGAEGPTLAWSRLDPLSQSAAIGGPDAAPAAPRSPRWAPIGAVAVAVAIVMFAVGIWIALLLPSDPDPVVLPTAVEDPITPVHEPVAAPDPTSAPDAPPASDPELEATTEEAPGEPTAEAPGSDEGVAEPASTRAPRATPARTGRGRRSPRSRRGLLGVDAFDRHSR